MFGTLRLVLALMVALAHVSVSVGGYHLGVPAVVGFYLLSGYVVASLLAPGSPMAARPMLFYGERALRLLPLYYFFALMGALAWQLAGPQPFIGVARPSLAQWLANLLIVPLNFFMFWPALEALVFIPPAWSLGLELQFYLLAPWLMRSRTAMAAAMGGTLAVHCLAAFGVVHTDWFGYRLLCGNLFVFLAGVWLYQARAGLQPRWPLVAAWAAMLLLAVASGLAGRWGVPFVLEVQVGFLVALPLVALLARLPRRHWDDAAGNLAYGAFLAHFPVMWLAARAGWLGADHGPLWLYVALVVLSAAVAHCLVERPLMAWRHRLRRTQLQGLPASA
ncbi:MAG TPA: acyltransferase family protein [Ramlibacter sp.]|nr:acyltransferase family protein [Ramlibacter sp.]